MKQKMKKVFLKILLVLIVIGIIGIMVCILINSRVIRGAEENILYSVIGETEIKKISQDSLKEFNADCALVLGCGIKDDETPSDMLKDRLDVGIELYKAGIVPKILLSGDNGQENYNEIHVMHKYTAEAGVPEEDIFCDHAGFSTYDSMYRAGSIFEVKRALVVTQEYHEYRALYIGKKLGLEVGGVSADQRSYFGKTYRESREVLARIKDFFKSNLRLKPVYGGDAIPISGSGIISH